MFTTLNKNMPHNVQTPPPPLPPPSPPSSLMFSDLPTNLVLEILTYLPLNAIASLALVSRLLHSLINSSENLVY